MTDDAPNRTAPAASSSSDTDRVERAVERAQDRMDDRNWRLSVDEHREKTEARLDKIDGILATINTHLATIDLNLAWFVRVLKWIGTPIAVYLGGAEVLQGIGGPP